MRSVSGPTLESCSFRSQYQSLVAGSRIIPSSSRGTTLAVDPLRPPTALLCRRFWCGVRSETNAEKCDDDDDDDDDDGCKCGNHDISTVNDCSLSVERSELLILTLLLGSFLHSMFSQTYTPYNIFIFSCFTGKS